ncbi:MAG: type IV pilus twitching motility protein PilT [Candidatus Hinthialibacter sp.]
MKILELLQMMIEEKASDLYLKVGIPPAIRVNSDVHRLKGDPITEEDMIESSQVLLTTHQLKMFEERPELDFAYNLDSGDRFRINLFRQQGRIGLVARYISDSDLSFASLHLPPVMQEMALLSRGLIVITGATGSGKSTTLAAMIHFMNKNLNRHIMTIEDPIEFIHVDDQCIINQREVGYDTLNFHDALRHVVRQSPDVILIGEMRDQETMLTAISAAETGHLVLTTLHTVDVFHTLDRIINYFPDHLKSQVRQELSLCLEGVVSMRLLRRADGAGRIPALEIMRSTPTIRKCLVENELWKMRELMQKGREAGMQTFNQALLDLYKQEVITFEEAMAASSNPDEFRLNAKGLFTGTDSIGLYEAGQSMNL